MSTSSLGKWVDGIFDEIYYQHDDEAALKAFEEYISPDVQIRANCKDLTRETWKKVLFDTRATNHVSALSSRELLAVEGDADVGVDGSISHHTTFAFKDKETGEKTREVSSVTIVTATWENGKRVMTRLTEVIV